MFRKALQFRAVCAQLTGQAAGGERADDMKDKVIKPPIPKKISIALMILFGVMAISITCFLPGSVSGFKKHWQLASSGELVYAEFDSVFRWVSTGNSFHYWVYAIQYVYRDENGNMYYPRGLDQFSSEEAALAFAASNDYKLAIKIDGEGHYVLEEDTHGNQILGIVLVGSFIVICYVISILSLVSLIRRIRYEKHPPSGWRYVE